MGSIEGIKVRNPNPSDMVEGVSSAFEGLSSTNVSWSASTG